MENLNSVDFKDLKLPFKGDLFLVWKIDEEREISSVLFATENEALAKFFCEKCADILGSNLLVQYTISDLIY